MINFRKSTKVQEFKNHKKNYKLTRPYLILNSSRRIVHTLILKSLAIDNKYNLLCFQKYENRLKGCKFKLNIYYWRGETSKMLIIKK